MRRSLFTREQALQLPNTARCAWCPDWTATGTLAETNEKARQHRAKKHPEVTTKKRTKRRRTMPQISDKTVEQNIAAVRVQGGAIWVTETDL